VPRGVVVEVAVERLRQSPGRPDEEGLGGILDDVVQHTVARLALVECDGIRGAHERVVADQVVDRVQADSASLSLAEEHVVEDPIATLAQAMMST